MEDNEIDYAYYSYNFHCPKCGSYEVYVKQTGQKTGAYCSECNTFIKWLTFKEIIATTKHRLAHGTENNAVKTYSRNDGVVTVKCSNCLTRLFTSDAPPAEGQFNLIGAKFCPNCGKEFI